MTTCLVPMDNKSLLQWDLLLKERIGFSRNKVIDLFSISVDPGLGCWFLLKMLILKCLVIHDVIRDVFC